MDANFILNLLAQRYAGEEWAFFSEFRPVTGFGSKVADALVIGLWVKNSRILAFEIKVARGDFLNDLNGFKEKHKLALGISEEFLYVCPWGLIDKSEVPELAGLMYVDQSNGLRIVKPAQIRTKDSLAFEFVQAIARSSRAKIEVSKIPAKLLGKDVTQEDIQKVVDEKVAEINKWRIDSEVEKKLEEYKKRDQSLSSLFGRMRDAAGLRFVDSETAAIKIIKRLEVMSAMSGLIASLKSINGLSQNMLAEIDKLRATGGEDQMPW